VASVTPVQSSDLRPNSPSPQAPKSGDPFAMLLDHVASKRVNMPEPRRRAEAADAPRVQKAEKPERPQPKQETRPAEEKTKPEAPKAKENAATDDTACLEEKVEAKDTDNSEQADATVTADAETTAKESVILPVDPEASQQASGNEDEGDTAEPFVEADDADDTPLIAADAALAAQAEVSAPQPVQPPVPLPKVIAPEASPVPAPVVAAEAAVDAVVETPVAVAPVKSGPTAETKPNAKTAVAADTEIAAASEDAPQTAPQAAEPEEAAPVQKPVASNHAEVRDAAIAEKGEQATQNTNTAKPEIPAQAKEHASMKPLEHVPAQSNVENTPPRQQVMQPVPAALPEPVRALAGSINPVNLRPANDGPSNAVPLNAQAIGVEITSRAKEGLRRFDIRLDPPELGRIDVRLEVDSAGKASTRLIVERPETLDLLQRDARNLERALQSAGLQTDEGGMEFSLRDQAQDGLADANGNGGYDRRDDFLASAIEDAEQAPPAIERYARSVFARGGVDIRI
jgi:flagellar hook-length control protein FliK